MGRSAALSLITAAVTAAAPCDIFESYETPCVAAHSVVRAFVSLELVPHMTVCEIAPETDVAASFPEPCGGLNGAATSFTQSKPRTGRL